MHWNIFQKVNVRTNEPREHFVVSRMEGSEELKSDLLSLYKDPRKKLRALPKVRFEGEQGVGVGPIREFFRLRSEDSTRWNSR